MSPSTRLRRSVLALSILALATPVSLACGVDPGDAAGAAFKQTKPHGEAKSSPKLMNYQVQEGGAAIVAPDMVQKIVAPDMVVKTENGTSIVAPDMVQKIVAPDMVQKIVAPDMVVKTENGTTILKPERIQK
ncbi:MAG: hypothetical protein H6710_09775 [Myxococcales bacterium]|nr:hypothetical protein [Myxococcales bacterium]MCB9700650.1 hypothetical protein [Myxococcales bacterium]